MAALLALGLVVLAVALVVLSPWLTSTDRERLQLAREVPYQAVNLIDHDAEEPRHYYLDMRTIVEKVRAAEYGTPALDADGVREAFLVQADWLVSMQSDDGGFYYEFDLPSRSLKAPWLSAMAQGEGMSVLVRAYYETDDEHYLKAAKDALRPRLLPIADGGLMHADETDLLRSPYRAVARARGADG